jgi:hypothetical protein
VLSGVRTNDMQFGLCGGTIIGTYLKSIFINGFSVPIPLLVASVSFHCGA